MFLCGMSKRPRNFEPEVFEEGCRNVTLLEESMTAIIFQTSEKRLADNAIV